MLTSRTLASVERVDAGDASAVAGAVELGGPSMSDGVIEFRRTPRPARWSSRWGVLLSALRIRRRPLRGQRLPSTRPPDPAPQPLPRQAQKPGHNRHDDPSGGGDRLARPVLEVPRDCRQVHEHRNPPGPRSPAAGDPFGQKDRRPAQSQNGLRQRISRLQSRRSQQRSGRAPHKYRGEEPNPSPASSSPRPEDPPRQQRHRHVENECQRIHRDAGHARPLRRETRTCRWMVAGEPQVLVCPEKEGGEMPYAVGSHDVLAG